MKFIDFFAGIGGFRRGLEMAGHKCVGYCEWDRYASMSYRAMHTITDEQREYLKTLPLKERQKEIEKEAYLNGEWYSNDIRTATGATIPGADVWTAGFPCQDISVAGKQLGFDGNRSSLFFQVIRLIKELQECKRDTPRILFFENVRNLLSVSNGWDFARVLFALADIGYNAKWAVINTKDFIVPQNRERVFIIAVRKDFDINEFNFPKGINTRLKDILEPTVDEKYYINNERANRLIEQLIEKNQIDAVVGGTQEHQIPRTDGLSPTLTSAMGEGGGQTPMILNKKQYPCDSTINNPEVIDVANCITARYNAGIQNQQKIGVAVCEEKD